MKRLAPGIVVLLLSAPWASAQLVVDAAADRRPISPLIYGVAFADTAELLELNVPLNRSGGNATSRYNWRINATNRAGDWYFESIADGPAIEGRAADDFVAQSRAGAAEPLVTIPIVGWVAKLGANRSILSSFSVARYGPQRSIDPWFPDAGNGVSLNGTKIANNDRSDASVPAADAFHAGWIEHLVSTWGASTVGGLRFLILDNEPSLWHETHRDVHPAGAGWTSLATGPARGRRWSARSIPALPSSHLRSGDGRDTSTADSISRSPTRTAGPSFPIATRTAGGGTCRGFSVAALPVAPFGERGSILITLPAKSATLLVIELAIGGCAGRCRTARPRQ